MPVQEHQAQAGPHSAGRDGSALDRLRHAIDHATHLLPAQGPINVFIHHNTLHAFENLRFDEAVRRGAEVFGCQPYLTENRYRAELDRGRIRFDDLREVLREDLGSRADDSLLDLGTRLDLRLAMLQHPVWSGPVAELLWLLTEADDLRCMRAGVSAFARGRLITETRRWVMRDLRGLRALRGNPAEGWIPDLIRTFGRWRIESWDEETWEAFTLHALWKVCRDGARSVPPLPTPPTHAIRHRDLLLQVAAVDVDSQVHDLLIRICAAFLDQGVSNWTMPERDKGLYHSFLTLYRRPGGPLEPWLRDLPREAARLLDSGMSPLESVRDSLDTLGVDESDWEDYLAQTLLALRGWAGMVCQVEQRSDAVAHQVPPGSLIELLAIRLLLDRLALSSAARSECGYTGSLASLREVLQQRGSQPSAPTPDQRAFPVFQLAQAMGWSPAELYRMTPGEWALLLSEVEAFSEIERRRVFHAAYERRFCDQALDALVLHTPYRQVIDRPRFQIVTCLDEREESFRRHLEEIAPDCQTFGAAGFFNVAIYYRGAADARFIPLCPIVLKPGHWIEEQVCDGHENTHRRRQSLRRVLGGISHWLHLGSRSMALGAAVSAGLGSLAAVPLVARTLFPRLASRMTRLLGHHVHATPTTRLKLERTASASGPEHEQQGYTVDEMATVSERLLRDIGLLSGFARLVVILGHGSESLNNPHKSAYDCGACGGSPGAGNGRALAQMLNDPRVRERIARNGVAIPADSWFVGGIHNTCDDSVTLYDVDTVPESHNDDLVRASADLENTCDRNAHERCRRFMSAPLSLSPDDARWHVESRSEDLAQPRPELGHATNALCVVGRRERTRGLFLDRRAFLVSYNPTQDDADGCTLGRLLGAAVPVCGGINLEYYFSHVDNRGYGCGTKLPHNITSLLGVMDGAASDLRTGLPWQMVEIHEPIRLLFVVESTPETLLRIMNRNPLVGNLVRNEWVQLAVLDPHSNTIRRYKDGTFVQHTATATHLPTAETSVDWYRGWRDHLEFAEIGG